MARRTPRRNKRAKVGFLGRISLRTRLTAISVSLIGLLLYVSSAGTIALLQTYLQQNTDTLLNSTASTLQHEDPAQLEERLASQKVQLPRLPSDYYIAYLDPKGGLLIGLVSAAGKTSDVPNISGFTSEWVASTKGIPFEITSKTTPKSNNGEDDKVTVKGWRMVAVPLTSMSGSLVVALPTTANMQLLNQYRNIGAGFGLLLLIISGAAIWMTISSALRPLREVERTATAVAAGDISQRLLERPGKTEIGRINSSLNTMLGSIESALSSRNQTVAQMRRFIADASHELRTPLVSVRGYAELYRMGALKRPEDIAEAMGRIESEAIRMSGLVESLLALARMDESSELKTTSTDLVSLARDAAKDASVADHSRQILINDFNGQAIAPGAQVMAEVDASQLRQVFTNLLANAARFSPNDAPIEVAIANAPNDRIVIDVRDSGEGIPKELREKVFERFFRADSSRNRDTGGSGLGLAIVKGIITRHGGSIIADETTGGGCTMRVTLPQHQPKSPK